MDSEIGLGVEILKINNGKRNKNFYFQICLL